MSVGRTKPTENHSLSWGQKMFKEIVVTCKETNFISTYAALKQASHGDSLGLEEDEIAGRNSATLKPFWQLQNGPSYSMSGLKREGVSGEQHVRPQDGMKMGHCHCLGYTLYLTAIIDPLLCQ